MCCKKFLHLLTWIMCNAVKLTNASVLLGIPLYSPFDERLFTFLRMGEKKRKVFSPVFG